MSSGAAEPVTELALAELEGVERELASARERRREMDIAEAGLWERRNELEQQLIGAFGAGWWRERRRAGGARRDDADDLGGDAA